MARRFLHCGTIGCVRIVTIALDYRRLHLAKAHPLPLRLGQWGTCINAVT